MRRKAENVCFDPKRKSRLQRENIWSHCVLGRTAFFSVGPKAEH
jgi:hypothetical protein